MAKLKLYDKDDGLRETLENGKVTYLDTFVDVFDNHYLHRSVDSLCKISFLCGYLPNYFNILIHLVTYITLS